MAVIIVRMDICVNKEVGLLKVFLGLLQVFLKLLQAIHG